MSTELDRCRACRGIGWVVEQQEHSTDSRPCADCEGRGRTDDGPDLDATGSSTPVETVGTPMDGEQGTPEDSVWHAAMEMYLRDADFHAKVERGVLMATSHQRPRSPITYAREAAAATLYLSHYGQRSGRSIDA